MTQINCPDHGMTICTNTITKSGVRGVVCSKCFAKFKGKWVEETINLPESFSVQYEEGFTMGDKAPKSYGFSVIRKIKPLSVNECWQGKRFKTPVYKAYETQLLYTLPSLKLPEAPYSIYYEFGFSNSLADLDNPIKPLTDILQKKYLFNDKDIFEAHIIKKKVKKGEEYFRVDIKTFNNQ